MCAKVVCPHGCGKEWVDPDNIRAEQPLDQQARKAADNAVAANCSRRRMPDGGSLKLTMSKDDYCCRLVWMDAYQKALKKPKAKVDPKAKTDCDRLVYPCPDALLSVAVTDYDDKPIPGVIVKVVGLGEKNTDRNGTANYGTVRPGTYNITAEKSDHRPAPGVPIGPAKQTAGVPAGSIITVPLKLDPLTIIRRENVIFVGSEMQYDSFWLKMMFMASAYVFTGDTSKVRSADKKTIAYVDEGYTRLEKLTLDYLRDKAGYSLVKLGSSGDVVNLINTRPEKKVGDKKERFLLQDVVFFSHGKPGVIKLNYNNSPNIDFSSTELATAKKDSFVPDGRIYSYACRTGVSSSQESFSDDNGADPDNSLAQKMANHFKVEVSAFLRRSFYGEVLREKSDSLRISEKLKKERATNNGKIIQIPPEHEALPHPGLANRYGAKKEGTNEYALWRKKGGIRLPSSGDTPAGLSIGMRTFMPKDLFNN